MLLSHSAIPNPLLSDQNQLVQISERNKQSIEPNQANETYASASEVETVRG